jgi:hypothetical protein
MGSDPLSGNQDIPERTMAESVLMLDGPILLPSRARVAPQTNLSKSDRRLLLSSLARSAKWTI